MVLPVVESTASHGSDEVTSTGSDGVVLRAKGLKRSFGRNPAVDGVDLEVREGEIYGFLGINGAGKTTTIRMLMGIIAAQAGTITLLGETTRRTSVRLKRHIGYVSQDQNFYPWMSCERLGNFVGSFYPTWDRSEFLRLLEIFEIPRNRRVSQLSGGMKAKLALALAVTPKPKLLILDEPTAGLDPVARRDFLDIIASHARTYRRTTFFSSHLIDEVERCADRIGIIHRGKMKFEGALGQLRDEVRLIHFRGDPVVVSDQFELWSERLTNGETRRTYRAPSVAWQDLQMPSDSGVERLSLEDIFLSCVGSRSLNW